MNNANRLINTIEHYIDVRGGAPLNLVFTLSGFKSDEEIEQDVHAENQNSEYYQQLPDHRKQKELENSITSDILARNAEIAGEKNLMARTFNRHGVHTTNKMPGDNRIIFYGSAEAWRAVISDPSFLRYCEHIAQIDYNGSIDLAPVAVAPQ